MIELHTQEFEKITFKRGVNVFSFAKAEQSELFLQKVEEAFYKRKKSSKIFLIQDERERETKDFYYIATSIGKREQKVKLHDVLLEKLVYEFYHDKKQMKSYYDFQCQYQMFLNQLEITGVNYNVLFHTENFQEKLFLKQLEFDVIQEGMESNASDFLKIYCDTKLSMREDRQEVITVVAYPETELGIFELSQFAEYVATLPGYVIVVTNTMKYFSFNDTHYNVYNRKSKRVCIEELLMEYQAFDSYVTLIDVISIVEYYLSGNPHLIDKRYEKMVKSSGIDEVNMI